MKLSSIFYFLLLHLTAVIFTFASGEVIFKDGLKNSFVLKLPSSTGPESLEFDCNGEGPYTGIRDGRILKWLGTHKGWVEFAVTSPKRDKKFCDGTTDLNKGPTCGSPLGLKFNKKTCNLYIADAYFGLLMVGPRGGVAKQLAISVYNGGPPFKFLNSLDVDDQTGVVYFSDSSSVYQLRQVQALISDKGDKTGRLLKYDPNTNRVEILMQGLALANGVSLNKDGSFVLIAEFNARKIIKFWLKGSKAHTSQLFATFERSPDNIKRDKNGDFWVGLNSNRTSSGNANKTRLGDDPVGVKLDEKGKTSVVLDGRGVSLLESVSEVKEHYGKLWVGSPTKAYVVVVKV